MKIVLDTNALVTASGDDYSYANRILDGVLAGDIQAFANRQTAGENRLIARRKVQDQEFQAKIERYFDALRIVDTEIIDAVEDREDNKILASALTAGVDYLVTADWHLLKLEEFQGVKIVTPQGFWAEYESETGQGWQDWMSKFIK